MKILGIETSCDETAAAVAQGPSKVRAEKVTVLSNVVFSQIDIFKKYGGVIPEVAAREHVLKILPVIDEALSKAKIKRPDVIAVTTGPGLVTSLLVGVETAKALAFAWDLPLIGVNHIEGHIYANFIESATKTISPSQTSQSTDSPITVQSSSGAIQFPALILTVSGGHTMLVLMKGHGQFKTLGQTRDDAAGEAFDKAAQILGLGYPGGPIVAQMADQYFSNLKTTKHSNASIDNLAQKKSTASFHQQSVTSIDLPRPMIDSKNYEFSFSGLKTGLLYKVQKDPDWKNRVPEYCAEFQQAVIDVLIAKTLKAAKEFKVKSVMLSGGVAANRELRRRLALEIKNRVPDTRFHIPDLAYCTDNAAMIAAAGYFRATQNLSQDGCAKQSNISELKKIKVNCSAELSFSRR